MKLFTVALATMSALASAQNYYDLQSRGFRLFVRSSNPTINGTALGACHQGAAIEGLCLTGETLQDPASSYTTFYHNISSANSDKLNSSNVQGILSWTLRLSNLSVPSAMSMEPSLESNVVNPTFFPGTSRYTLVAFEENGSAYIAASRNDTGSPPGYFNPSLKLKNWYICLTNWSYLYQTLSWKVGVTCEPQNPSCKKVEVVRVFN